VQLFRSLSKVMIGARNRIAEIDSVGTHPRYHQRGFPKVVVSQSFQRLRARGMTTAYIGPGPAPYASNRLCESLQPVERHQENRWVKRWVERFLWCLVVRETDSVAA